MPDALQDIRLKEFRARPLHWIVVYHLLPAGLLRELASAIIEVGTEGRLCLHDLFENIVPAGPAATSSWFIAARETGSPFSDFLSRLIMTMVWRGDETPSPPHDGVDDREAVWVRELNGALQLSSEGLDATANQADWEDQGALHDVFAALAAARRAINDGGDEGTSAVATDVDGPPALLKALLVKHVGDLNVDLDRWDGALSYYRKAEMLLCRETGWDDAVGTARDIFAQSVAMATWHVDGPDAAAPLLEALAEKRGIDDAPLAALNARFDLLNARFARGSLSTEWSDKRAADYLAPLVIHSHDLDNAMTYTSVGKYREAHRWFWATLRRQAALGGTVTSWATKGHYGRSIVEELLTLLGRQNLPDHFALAIRMLVESGRADLVEKISWSAGLVETYVNDGALDEMVEIVKRSPGVAIERSLAATALRREWLLVLPGDREVLARRMLSDLTKAARTGAHTGMTSTSTGGLALKSLKAVGKARPEFRTLVGPGLIRLMDDILANHGALTVSEALETAAEFVDGVDSDTVKALCKVAIGLVERLPPDAAWPIRRAATKLLGSNTAARVARNDDAFQRDRSVALVKLGLNSAQEHTGLLYLLRDVDPSVVSEQIDAQGLDTIVAGIRKSARETSSSGATSNIHALLVAPKVAGPAGVADALRGMLDILRSARNVRPSPSLHDGYEVLLLLARHGSDIAGDLGDASSFIHDAKELLEPLCEMWQIAASRPLIFAGFAIPPLSVPNRVAVHNWTFATLEFAKWLNASTVVEPALNAASLNEFLVEGMSVARAMQGTAAAAIDAAEVATERADAFYAALGERLAGIGSRVDADAAADLRIMLDRCMEVGPRGEDAALLLASKRLDVLLDPEDAEVVAYIAKLRNEPKLRLSLSPLLQRALAPVNGA